MVRVVLETNLIPVESHLLEEIPFIYETHGPMVMQSSLQPPRIVGVCWIRVPSGKLI